MAQLYRDATSCESHDFREDVDALSDELQSSFGSQLILV
jgi:hypothetical protein